MQHASRYTKGVGEETLLHLSRTPDMRKTLFALTMAAALTSGQAFADQATLESLQAAGIVLSDEQAAIIAAAEGQALADAIAALVKANPQQAATIVGAAVKAAPGLAVAITEAAVKAAPEHKTAIANAAKAAAPAQADAIQSAADNAVTVNTEGSAVTSGTQINNSNIPGTTGGSGGGDNTASPNTVTP